MRGPPRRRGVREGPRRQGQFQGDRLASIRGSFGKAARLGAAERGFRDHARLRRVRRRARAGAHRVDGRAHARRRREPEAGRAVEAEREGKRVVPAEDAGTARLGWWWWRWRRTDGRRWRRFRAPRRRRWRRWRGSWWIRGRYARRVGRRWRWSGRRAR